MTPTRRSAAEMHDRAVAGNDEPEQKWRLFNSSVGVDPDFAMGWFSVGNRLGDMGLLEASAAAYWRMLSTAASYTEMFSRTLPSGPMMGASIAGPRWMTRCCLRPSGPSCVP